MPLDGQVWLRPLSPIGPVNSCTKSRTRPIQNLVLGAFNGGNPTEPEKMCKLLCMHVQYPQLG